MLFSRQPDKAVINDSNPELINVYLTIEKNEPEALIEKLKEHKVNSSEEYFYSIFEHSMRIKEVFGI